MIILCAQTVPIPSSFVPTTTPLSLHYSDFRWFSSAPPGPLRLDASSWLLTEPNQTRDDGKLAVDDAASLRAFSLDELSFSATFLTGTTIVGRPSAFADELVVFATTDATAFHGFEFGIRTSLSDGFVYAYSQFSNPFGGVSFQEQRLFANDGQAHAYDLTLVGSAVSFTVDGTLESIEFYPVAPPSEFYVVGTAHRASEGWSASGLGIVVSDVTVHQPSL